MRTWILVTAILEINLLVTGSFILSFLTQSIVKGIIDVILSENAFIELHAD